MRVAINGFGRIGRSILRLALARDDVDVVLKPLVSADLRGRPESLIISGPEISVTTHEGLLRIFGWYDNEWGFANRMLDVAQMLGPTDRRT